MSEELNTWGEALKDEFEKPYFKQLYNFVMMEYQKETPIYPPKSDILNALRSTPLDKVKVVILGQDPYHNAGQAHGLSFSVNKGIAIPPSLLNIYKELRDDSWLLHSQQRRFDQMGQTRRSASQYNSYCKSPSATVSQGNRLGDIYRFNY